MPRPKRTKKEISKSKLRIEEYRKLFRYFDSVSDGITWVRSILGCKVITAMVWRMRSGYGIPEKKMALLRENAMSDIRFKGLYN